MIYQQKWNIFLVPILTTKEALAPLANDSVMSGTSIWSFRHLKHQTAEMIFQFIFSHQGGIGATCQWSHHVGKIDTVL